MSTPLPAVLKSHTRPVPGLEPGPAPRRRCSALELHRRRLCGKLWDRTTCLIVVGTLSLAGRPRPSLVSHPCVRFVLPTLSAPGADGRFPEESRGFEPPGVTLARYSTPVADHSALPSKSLAVPEDARELGPPFPCIGAVGSLAGGNHAPNPTCYEGATAVCNGFTDAFRTARRSRTFDSGFGDHDPALGVRIPR